MDLQDIFAYIDQHRRPMLEQLLNYLRLPSISVTGEGISETTAYLMELLHRLGFTARVIPTPGWPILLGQRLNRPGAPTVLLYGHYDVQPPDPLDAWVTPPFEPTLRHGRIYARGAGDNKGQHFAQLMALSSWLTCQGELPCNVIVLLEGEEEIGSPHMADFVRAHQSELAADLVIISDGPVHESGRSQIVCGVRGIVSFELRAQGANRDLHSGNWGGIAPNPLWTLVHLLATMKNARGEITIDGFYDHVLPLTSLEQQALTNLPADSKAMLHDLGLQQFDAPPERGIAERLTAWPTLTINGLHGGYSGPGTKTVIPQEAFAKCDMRLVEAQRVDDIKAKVEAHVHAYAPTVTIIWQGAMEPSKTSLNSPWLVPIHKGIVTAQEREPLVVPTLGGSLPEYVFTHILDLPTFGIPYANADEANHAPNENLEVERFFQGIKTGAAMLAYLSTYPHAK